MEELNLPLQQTVYSEAAMLELRGIDKKTLDDLRRDKDFDFLRLTTKSMVYLMMKSSPS